MTTLPGSNRRILVVDDNASIHDDFCCILTPRSTSSDIDAEAASFFGTPLASPRIDGNFVLKCAHQGQEALTLVTAAKAEGHPFALAFVDMRMPPGWDGLTTIRKLWEVDPHLQVVICTAHSDRTWEEIETTLTCRDRWAVLKKPFDKIEVVQLAHVMVAKWNLGRALADLPTPSLHSE